MVHLSSDVTGQYKTPSVGTSRECNFVAFAQMPSFSNVVAASLAVSISSKMPKQLAPLPDIWAARHLGVFRSRARLRKTPKCRAAQMSGSGASCFGIFDDIETARLAATTFENDGIWAKATKLHSLDVPTDGVLY